MTAQRLPSQCSIRVCNGEKINLPEAPTAHTSPGDEALTLLSELASPRPSGLGTLVHRSPFQ